MKPLPQVPQLVEEITQLHQIRDQFASAKPAAERVIDGEPCRGLRWDRTKRRTLIWVDRENRIRAMEEYALTDSATSLIGSVSIEYDVPIAPGILKPDFLKSTKAIEPEARLAAMLSLDKVLASTEELGLVVAVHDIINCGGGRAIVLISARASEQTLTQLGPATFAQALGSYATFQLLPPGLRPTYRAYEIGQISSRGIFASWWLLEGRGQPDQEAQKFGVQVIIHTDGRLRKHLESNGTPWWKEGIAVGTVQMPEKRQAFAEVLASIYKQASEFEKTGSIINTVFADIPVRAADGTMPIPYVRPSKTSPARMAEAIEKRKKVFQEMLRKDASSR